MRDQQKWAQRILDEKSPETFFVQRRHAHQPWVREAVRKGAKLYFVEVPWYVRLWWWFKRVVLRRGEVKYANGQTSKTLRAPSSPALQGPGARDDGDSRADEDDLF